MSLAHACPHVDRSWFKCYETIEVYASSVKTIVFLKKNKKKIIHVLCNAEITFLDARLLCITSYQLLCIYGNESYRTFQLFILNSGANIFQKSLGVSDKFSFFLSVTAEKWVPIIEVPVDSVKVFLEKKKREGFSILGLEQTANSIPLDQYTYPRKTVSSAHKFDLLFSLNI